MTTKVQDATMFKTKEYGAFKLLNYNRKVDASRVNKIAASIAKHGFILPILVDREMNVVDGQHRLAAAQKANSEVVYIMYDTPRDYLPILVSNMNSLSKNWKIREYYQMWAELGYESFVWVADLVQMFNLFYDEIDKIIFFQIKDSRPLIKDGQLRFTDTQKERIAKLCQYLNDNLDARKEFQDFGSEFRYALITAMMHPEYDHDRMQRKLFEGAGSIVRAHDRKGYVMQLDTVYNKGEKYSIDFTNGLKYLVGGRFKTK